MIYIDSDTVFYWSNMVDSITYMPVANAVVSGILKDLSGTTLYAFDFVGDSNSYKGSIPADHTTDLIDGEIYQVEITATVGDTIEKRIKQHKAQYRGFAQ